MFILYLLQYLDKTSLGYTAIMGIIEDAVRNLWRFPNRANRNSISSAHSTLGSPASSMLASLWLAQWLRSRWSNSLSEK